MSAHFKRIETLLQILLCALLLKGLQYWQPHPDRDDMASMILVSGHLDDYNRLFSPDTSSTVFRKAAYWQAFFNDKAPVDEVLDDLKRYDVHPPLFFAAAAFLNRFTESTEEALLLLQFICWALSIVIFQWTARRWGLDEKGIRITGWLLVFSPWCLACFGEYRHYGLMFLEATLLLGLFPRRDLAFSWQACAAWGLVWAFTFATHYGSLFFGLSILLYFLLTKPPRWIWYAVAMGIGFGLFLGVWPAALDTLSRADNGESFSLVRGFKIIPALLSFNWPVWNAFVWDGFSVTFLMTAVTLFMLLKIRSREYLIADPLWIGLLFAGIYTLLSISGRIPGHAAGGKYLAFAYPSLLLALALRLQQWQRRSLMLSFSIGFVLTLSQELYVREEEPNMQLLEELPETKRFMSTYPEMFTTFRLVYMLPPETPVFIARPGEQLPAIESGDMVWYDNQDEQRPWDRESRSSSSAPLQLRSTVSQGWLYQAD